MLAIAGTVPDNAFPLYVGPATLAGDMLELDGRKVEVARGTPALLAAALAAADALDAPPPRACLVGDEGQGAGSRKLYDHLAAHLREIRPDVMVFHYLQPEVDGHGKTLLALQQLEPRPILVADAGFMYAAKMSGQASEYDLFTPDAGELAFLADEQAPHPFYTRGFILQGGETSAELAQRAYAHSNAARCLLVKGETDYVISSRGVLFQVDGPGVRAAEAMGGTGDTLTGLAAVLIATGLDTPVAAHTAALANRLAAKAADPTPAGRITELIACIPKALRQALDAVNP